jgi:hypothetical protein
MVHTKIPQIVHNLDRQQNCQCRNSKLLTDCRGLGWPPLQESSSRVKRTKVHGLTLPRAAITSRRRTNDQTGHEQQNVKQLGSGRCTAGGILECGAAGTGGTASLSRTRRRTAPKKKERLEQRTEQWAPDQQRSQQKKEPS